MATLYVIGTPIGNLEDVTLRSLRILKEVDLILCEDTRVTKKLLSHFDIKTPTMSYHAQSALSKVDKIFDLFEEGKNLALVSDAGTPCISDPGVMLVEKVREHFGGDVNIVAVPGASALTSAISIAGIPASEFTFLGFLPHKKGRDTLFKEIADGARAFVFYESPHRVMKTLEKLATLIPKNRKIVVGRELTKMHEQIVSGSGLEVLEYFSNNSDKVRGEFVVIVSK